MILVRMVFQCRPGQAGELVKNFVEYARSAPTTSGHVRLMTDLSGPFDTVVEEVEAESVDAFLQEAARMWADPQWGQMMAQYVERVVGGGREYYTIEYAS